MKTIFKYKLEIKNEQTIEMPACAKILSAKDQFGDLCIWAMIDTEQQVQPRTIRIIGTGHQVVTGLVRHIETVIQGPMVWHIFEQI